jgi:tetratricopeptide (TPR) repeat protein
MKTEMKHRRELPKMGDAQHLLRLAKEWMKQGNTTVAVQLLNEAMKLNEAAEDRLVKGEISKEMGRVYMQTGQWELAEDAYQDATAIFLEFEQYSGAAESVRNLANMKFQQGRFCDSNSLCETAVCWATKSGDYQLRATIFNTLGAIKSVEGNQRESIKILRLCLSDFRSTGNRLRQAYTQHNIGLAQLEVGDYIESRRSLEEALALALEQKDLTLVALCYQNIAKLYLKTCDLPAAQSLIKAAHEINNMLNSPNISTDLAIIEAESYRLGGDIKEARGILESALGQAREHKLTQHEAEILSDLGQLSIEMGRYEEARTNLEAAIALFKKTGGGLLNKAVSRLKDLEIRSGKEA